MVKSAKQPRIWFVNATQGKTNQVRKLKLTLSKFSIVFYRAVAGLKGGWGGGAQPWQLASLIPSPKF